VLLFTLSHSTLPKVCVCRYAVFLKRTERQNTVLCCFGKESHKISAYEIYERLHGSLHIEEGEIVHVKRQVLIRFITGQPTAPFLRRTNGRAFYENKNVKSVTSASVLHASYTAYILLICHWISPLMTLRKLWRNLVPSMILEINYGFSYTGKKLKVAFRY